MQTPVTHPVAEDPQQDPALRTKALVALGVACLAALGGWWFLSTATQRGVARLAAIDRVRGQCDSAWRVARSHPETLLVDGMALRDTIDARSENALMQCGDLRKASTQTQLPNTREMTGEPMPRGLR
jgi:hypothetical protein